MRERVMRVRIDRVIRARIMRGMDTVQSIILRLRAAGMSQSEIARRLKGVPQARISRWEKGEAPPSVDDALRLAELLREHESGAKRQSARRKVAA